MRIKLKKPSGLTALQSSLKLGLDFRSTNSLDSRITFTRADATSCATYFDSTGRLAVAAANTPRFDYDPATPAGVTGGELVTNGGFDSATGWSVSGAWAISGGVASGDTAAFTQIEQPLPLAAGKTYRVTYTVQAAVSGSVQARFIGGTQVLGTVRTAAGTYTENFVAASGNTSIRIQSQGSGFNGSIDNISIQEVTFAPKGLLIEESRTNLCLRSDAQSTAPWTVNGAPAVTATVAPDGSNNAMNINAVVGTAGYYQMFAPAGNSTYTFSKYVKKVSGTGVGVRIGSDVTVWGASTAAFADFNLDTLAFTTITGTVTTGYQSVGNGWYRIWLTATTVAVPGASVSILNYGTLATGVVTTWGNQVELGAFPTSYIPTTTAAVTRAADSAVMTGTNFSSWFNAAAGTFVAEADMLYQSTVATRIWDVFGTTRFDGMLAATKQGQLAVNVSFPTVVNQITLGAPFKLAGSYDGAGNSVTLNGGGIAGDTSTFSGSTALVIGSSNSSSNFLNGHIRRIAYYNTRLPDAQLQALTV